MASEDVSEGRWKSFVVLFQAFLIAKSSLDSLHLLSELRGHLFALACGGVDPDTSECVLPLGVVRCVPPLCKVLPYGGRVFSMYLSEMTASGNRRWMGDTYIWRSEESQGSAPNPATTTSCWDEIIISGSIPLVSSPIWFLEQSSASSS